jgi:5'-deoxynucleotidase YfbR-like HD superfamily hydrolase
MSIWNRIGDVASTIAKNTVKFGGELAGSAGSAARFGWDVGTAPWNDAEEYNGFIQPFKTAAETEGKDIIKPLASAAGAIMKVPGVQPALERIGYINQEYIREPLTTFELAQGEVNKRLASGNIVGAATGFFEPNVWKKAYTGAQDISFGQAFVGAYRSSYDPKFNIYDPSQRDAAFNKSAWGKGLSGGLDLGIQFFGDVTLAAGKVGKVLKASELGVGKLTNADAVAKAAEDITKAQFGVNNRMSKVLDNFTKNDSVYALSHPMVKSSSQPGLLANLLGDSIDRDETALILRSALGDPAAMDELRLQRAYITDALEAARGDLSAVDEYKLFAAPDGTGMIPFLNDNPAIIEQAKANYSSLAESDKYFAKMMQIGEGGGTLTRTTGKGLQQAENFVAESRSLKFYDKTVGASKLEVFQPTPFHRLYQKISWAAGERPAGLVDFNDADSYREIVATISRLEKRIDLTPEQSRGLLNNYISAPTPEARFVATQNLEESAMRALGKKYNIDEEKMSIIYNGYRGARLSALQSIKDRGFMVDTDGSIIKVQQLESQSADFLPLMDFDLMDRLLKRNAGTIGAFVGKGKDFAFHYADVLQDAFKAGALLRLGYTQRNAIDSQLRIAASVGAMASLRHLGPGLKNITNNTIRVPARLVDKYNPLGSAAKLSTIQSSSTRVISELQELKTKIGAAEAKLSLDPNDVDLLGEVNTLKLLQEEKLAIYNHYADALSKSKKARPKDRIGTGTYKITTSDGQIYELDDAFGGPLGDMFRKIASSGNSFERMVDSNTDMYTRNLASKGIQAIRPTDPAYFDQWAQTLRQQFGNSAVVKKIVRGETIDDISRWLKSSPEGRDLRRRLSIPSDESAEYVTKISNFFDTYLPVSSNLRNKLSDITADDLRTTFKDPTDLPIIHGHLLEETFFNVSDNKIKKIINGAFKLLATLPEDTLARNPLYIYFYRQEAARRVNIVAGLKGDRISLEDQEKIMAIAHRSALREMKGVLFNIERKSNLAMAMKYINPFFSAQENSYKTWMKFAVANPAIVNRGYMVWQAPNEAGLVTDQEGNIVPAGQTSGSDIMWFSLPKGVRQAIPGAASLSKFGIPKASLDIIFQGGMDALYNKGNPNMFSDIFPTGPYVSVPVAEITKNQPSTRESLKWLFPYGYPKDAVSGFLPAWVQKLQTRAEGQSDPQFARSYQLIWNTEQQRAKRNGRGPVSPDKVLRMTKDYWNMRVAANLIMPFAPRFDSPYKYYLDKSREYKRIYGIEADAKFLNDFPEFFSFSSSLSKNTTGVQSSIAATKNINKYSELIGQVVNIDPKLVGLIVNDPSGYDFSQSAYDYLYKKRISADSPDRFLSSQSPAEAQKKTDAEKGWIQYNKFADLLDNELAARGLTSIQQSGAEDLAIIKSAFINKLSVQTDAEGKPILNEKTGEFERTAWYDDYLDDDGSKTNRVIAGLGKILNDSKFVENNKNSTTWKSIDRYIEFRKILAKELLSREVKSITAKANIDLKIIYDGFVNKLKQDDKLGFSYVYDRFLSQDSLVDKQLTSKGDK